MSSEEFSKPAGEHGPYVSSGGRKGDWMQTSSGIQFWPMDPRPEEVNIKDIAKALSNLCRFGGHMPKGFYSVAQHSVLVSMHVEQQIKETGASESVVRTAAATGLMHDSPEAYLIDVPRPIKRHLQGYYTIEYNLACVIGGRYGLSLAELPPLVRLHDDRALMTEKRDLLGPPPAPWGEANGAPAEPWSGGFMVGSHASTWSLWTPREAERAFLLTVERLGIQ